MEFRFFKDDLCDRCGLCLQQCPVLQLPLAEAQKDIIALISGETAFSLAYQWCTTCYTCDLLCPLQANPYELILERWHEEHQSKGISAIAKLVFPNVPANIWASTRALMSKDELALIYAWEENLRRRKRVMLLTGFYTNLMPYIAATSLLDELKPSIAGFEGFWGCGGDIYKLGMLEHVEATGNMLHQKFVDLGVEKLYCFMSAEAMMLSQVLPERFGIDFSFCSPEPLDYWILDRLKRGKIEVKQRLGKVVTVHDSCLSKYRGGKLQEVVRETMDYIGCRIVEMEHNRKTALCCGWAATIPTLHGAISGNPLHTLLYLLHSLYLRLQEAEATGAEVVVVNCHACYLFLSLIKALTNSKLDIYLSFELVQLAAGEIPQHRNERRAWDIMAVVSNLLFRWLFFPEERRGFEAPPVTMEPVPALATGDAVRLKLLGRLYHSRAVQNRLVRRLLGAVVKSSINGYRRLLRKRQHKMLSGLVQYQPQSSAREKW